MKFMLPLSATTFLLQNLAPFLFHPLQRCYNPLYLILLSSGQCCPSSSRRGRLTRSQFSGGIAPPFLDRTTSVVMPLFSFLLLIRTNISVRRGTIDPPPLPSSSLTLPCHNSRSLNQQPQFVIPYAQPAPQSHTLTKSFLIHCQIHIR